VSPAHSTVATETDRVRRIFEKEAGGYDRKISLFEKVLFGGGREWVCSQAEGEVLEIAAGTGRNLPLYPENVRLTAIELSPAMLDIARRRQSELGRQADLRIGDAQALDFPDAGFDTVVCTLGLCTIPDDSAAVAEMHRVLRPGGRVLLLEHVRSPGRVIRRGQRILDPLFVRWQGDHIVREPLEHLHSQGFVIDRLERSKLGIVERIAGHKPEQAQNDYPDAS
jgi:ubiquinone/menaquinone biosynthesis C-methylase UbiE